MSVIIPIYNAQDYLHECLDSLINQTLTDIEIICVDDESTDDTPQILEEYARKNSRIQVIRQENGGAGAARNRGMAHATGEYLSILDCDDFFAPDMLEKSYQRAKEQDLDIVVFGCDFYDTDSKAYRPCNYSINRRLLPDQAVFTAQDVRQDVFRLFIGWSWDKLFRRTFVEEHGLQFQVQRTTNDLLFVFSALLYAQRIGVMDDIFAHYRCGTESLSVTREKSWTCFYQALMALRDEMYKIGCYERFEQDFKNYCVNFTLWNLRTLKEPTHTLLYNKLRDEWFEEMDLLKHPKEYFYHEHEYVSFRRIYENPVPVGNHDTMPTGLVSRIIRCYQDHGLLYTVKHMLRKVCKH